MTAPASVLLQLTLTPEEAKAHACLELLGLLKWAEVSGQTQKIPGELGAVGVVAASLVLSATRPEVMSSLQVKLKAMREAVP